MPEPGGCDEGAIARSLVPAIQMPLPAVSQIRLGLYGWRPQRVRRTAVREGLVGSPTNYPGPPALRAAEFRPAAASSLAWPLISFGSFSHSASL
jgi:hypothetical protein